MSDKQTPSHLANRFSDWLEKLSQDDFASATILASDDVFFELRGGMNQITDKVRGHQEELKKGNALRVRYEVAARAMDFRDLDDLLTRSLHALRNVAQSEAAMVWLIDHQNKIKLAASTGIRDSYLIGKQSEPLKAKLTQKAIDTGMLQVIESDSACVDLLCTPPCSADDEIRAIAVPLVTHGKTLGIFNLFVEKKSLEKDVNLQTMLEGVTRHLAVGVENARIIDLRLQKVLQEERTQMAHELHDSLAQSIASLRFQVRVLDQTLQSGNDVAIWQEMERIEESIETANAELRELIQHFRGPRNERNIVTAIQELIERFKQINGIQVYFQKEWQPVYLPREIEIQMYRIVQEALSNIRKHAKANMVRVLVRYDEQGDVHLLIEDDGIGIRFRDIDDFGDHFGVKIMQERAQKLGGTLKIEGEAGEGTRIMLDFHYEGHGDTDTGRTAAM